jgi:fatty-acyl-CoA synthase
MPHIEIKIVDPATGLEVGPNTPGEICCRGYNVMKGYYKMPEETRSTIDQEGWLHSGDLAVVDEQGYYRITGRIKDMIIRGGENIYPREIEEFLHTMPGISDVQVVGVPDERYGETVGAFIIPSGNPVISEETVKTFCKDRIARYKIPKHIFFVENYPMTASGKIQKFKLREMAAESVATQA